MKFADFDEPKENRYEVSTDLSALNQQLVEAGIKYIVVDKEYAGYPITYIAFCTSEVQATEVCRRMNHSDKVRKVLDLLG